MRSELDTRTVASAMTQRDRIAWFDIEDSDDIIRVRMPKSLLQRIRCAEGDIDHIVGYVETLVICISACSMVSLFLWLRPISFKSAGGYLIASAWLAIGGQFRQVGEDFA